MTAMLLVRNPGDGEVLDATRTMYPSRLEVVRGGQRGFERETSTVYGFVQEGTAHLAAAGLGADLEAGGFFVVPGKGAVSTSGVVVVMERYGFRGLLQAGVCEIGSPGRLAYIDGCSDTILGSPPRLGDPVLNHLHFPRGVVQSLHSHPSIRLGVVASGSGKAFGPESGGWEQPLSTGAVFLLGAHEVHAFKTEGTSLDVVAFHPDSDWGPTDDAHPMRSRTYLARLAR